MFYREDIHINIFYLCGGGHLEFCESGALIAYFGCEYRRFRFSSPLKAPQSLYTIDLHKLPLTFRKRAWPYSLFHYSIVFGHYDIKSGILTPKLAAILDLHMFFIAKLSALMGIACMETCLFKFLKYLLKQIRVSAFCTDWWRPSWISNIINWTSEIDSSYQKT